mmetsp:Transcript_19199/g.13889  ORF Transcript_19199/g.13889 Transcript_19199/m.13889 type:complete len:144 (-) Transcript_19199:585-1016(-)
MLKLMNESAVTVENNFIKEAYKFDYFIQIDLSAVNGLTLRPSQTDGLRKKSRTNKAIANIFFRFSHRDTDAMILTNKNQVKIVERLAEMLAEKVKQAEFTEESQTFVPYYDSILSEEMKSELAEIKMTEMCGDRVKTQGLKRF